MIDLFLRKYCENARSMLRVLDNAVHGIRSVLVNGHPSALCFSIHQAVHLDKINSVFRP